MLGPTQTGYTLERIEANPPLAKVLVPLALSQNRFRIRTEPIVLDQLNQTTTVTPRLLLPPDVRLVDGKPLGIKVTIFIRPSTEQVSQRKSF